MYETIQDERLCNLSRLSRLDLVSLLNAVFFESIEESVSGDSEELGRLNLVFVGLCIGGADDLLDNVIEADPGGGNSGRWEFMNPAFIMFPLGQGR